MNRNKSRYVLLKETLTFLELNELFRGWNKSQVPAYLKLHEIISIIQFNIKLLQLEDDNTQRKVRLGSIKALVKMNQRYVAVRVIKLFYIIIGNISPELGYIEKCK